jgi:protein-S-isoprenylcysteine O-methyltransferase Ste14
MTSPSTRVPALGTKGEGWLALQVVFMIAIPLAAWRASLVDDASGPVVDAARSAGAVALLGGLGLIAWASVRLDRGGAFSALPRPLATGSLVRSGPYRFVRHPIYVGLILAGLGAGLIRVSLLVGVLAVGLAIVLDLKRRREEAWLLRRYPDYATYRGETKAFVPFVY